MLTTLPRRRRKKATLPPKGAVGDGGVAGAVGGGGEGVGGGGGGGGGDFEFVVGVNSGGVVGPCPMRVSPPLRSLKVRKLPLAAEGDAAADGVRLGAVVEVAKTVLLTMVMELATLLPAVETLKAEVTLRPRRRCRSHRPRCRWRSAGGVGGPVGGGVPVCWVVELAVAVGVEVHDGGGGGKGGVS